MAGTRPIGVTTSEPVGKFWLGALLSPVMAGLVPAIPTGTGRENCATDRGYGGCGDGLDKPGHDGEESVSLTHPLILTPMGARPAMTG